MRRVVRKVEPAGVRQVGAARIVQSLLTGTHQPRHLIVSGELAFEFANANETIELRRDHRPNQSHTGVTRI